MIRAFRSEWSKFLRPGQLLGSWGTMAGFGLLLAVLLISNASDDVTEAQQQPGQGPTLPVSLLEAADGGSFSFQATGQLLGIIALVIAAANVATEYTSGTLKVLLVREPRRTVLMTGKVTALWTFILVGITLTLLLSFLASVLVAAAKGIDMQAWWSADGWSALFEAYGNVVATSFVWALLGVMLAVLFRSGFPAIGVGIAYPLVVEGLLGLVLPDVVKWMPGSVLATVASGDASAAFGEPQGIGYGAALTLAAVYAAVFAAVSLTLIARRDVS